MNIPCNIETAEYTVLIQSEKRKWKCFLDPVEILKTGKKNEIMRILDSIESKYSGKYYIAGFISYEAASAFDPVFRTRELNDFPYLWFGIFKTMNEFEWHPECIDPTTENTAWKPEITKEEYAAGIRKIKDYIKEGDTYQVNFTYRMHSAIDNPFLTFQSMINQQSGAYGAYIGTSEWIVASASPELFFKKSKNRIISSPMKGTASRGLSYADDLLRGRALKYSEKNRAENLMITDMVRNDLGRISLLSSVKTPVLFKIEKYPAMWQMTSKVEAHTRSELQSILRGLFPAASITGTPKIRSMEIIHEQEKSPRKIYTGTIGYIDKNKNMQFNVAIRTLIFDKKKNAAEYGTGGGIVWDSDHSEEKDESLLKADILKKRESSFQLLETIFWDRENGYMLLDNHLKRMKRSAIYFNFICNVALIRERLKKLESSLKKNNIKPSSKKIRLLLSYTGKIDIEVHDFNILNSPFHLGISEQPIDCRNKFLYHKTTKREIYEKHRKLKPELDDVLLWNKAGEITETTIANILIKEKNYWITPAAQSGLLAGTYRDYLLRNKRVIEKKIKLDDLKSTDSLFLMNSLRGIWKPVFHR